VKHNVFRNGKVHVMAEECSTCIFRPATRPVDGSRVAGMVRDTMDKDGASVVCHSTLYKRPRRNAVCRGWFDRLADRDITFRMAIAMKIIEEQEA
jgi:hypothetical protein